MTTLGLPHIVELMFLKYCSLQPIINPQIPLLRLDRFLYRHLPRYKLFIILIIVNIILHSSIFS